MMEESDEDATRDSSPPNQRLRLNKAKHMSLESVRRNRSLQNIEFHQENVNALAQDNEEILKLENIRKSRAAVVEECQYLQQENDQQNLEILHKEVNDMTKKRAVLAESGNSLLQQHKKFDPSLFSDDEQKIFSLFQERLNILNSTNSIFPSLSEKYSELTENSLKSQLQKEALEKEKELYMASPGFCEHLLNEKKKHNGKRSKTIFGTKRISRKITV